MKTIVAAYDATEASDRALERAAVLAERFGAKLIVTSVGRPLPIFTGGDAVGAGAGPLIDDSGYKVADEHLTRARERLAAHKVEVEYNAEIGRWTPRIIQLADDRSADMIVVASRHPNFLTRLVEGNLSDDLARQAHCDVLIVQ